MTSGDREVRSGWFDVGGKRMAILEEGVGRGFSLSKARSSQRSLWRGHSASLQVLEQ